MKKNFLKYATATILLTAVSIFLADKIEAAVTAWISASPSTSVTVNTPVTISYGSTGADSCKINGNTVSANSNNSFVINTSNPGTFTYTISCQHLVVVPTGTCRGTVVAGSTMCDGSGGEGPDEGISCSYFTTKETCNPSSCNSWFHHGCSWLAS